MAIKCDFARWGKVRNSSELCPESEFIATTDILFKNSQSIIDPVITCNINDVSVKDWYQYAYEFRYCRLTFPEKEVSHIRYYFVENVSFSGMLVIFTLTTDVLATYRDRLRLFGCWVSRSANPNLNNYTIMDNNIAQTGIRRFYQQTFRVAENNYSAGFYVVGIINNDENQVGAVTYYAFTENGFKKFCTQIFGSGNYAGLDGSSTDLATFRAVFNPIQYITTCIYIPWEITDAQKASAELSTLAFGWYGIRDISNCWRLNVTNTGIMGRFYKLSLFKHPQVEEVKNDTINVDPYMQITFHSPPWGDITLDTTILMDRDTLKMPISLDPITGLSTIEFFASYDNDSEIHRDDVFMGRYSSQMGISISLAQISKDNYAIQTAIATKNANVMSAQYSQNLNSFIMTGITSLQKATKASEKSLQNMTTSFQKGDIGGGLNYLGNYAENVWNTAGNVLSDIISNVGQTPDVTAKIAAANASGTESIVKAQQPQVTVISSGVNSVASYNFTGYLQYSYYDVIPPDYTKIGYPVCKMVETFFTNGCWGYYVLCNNVTIKPGQFDECFPAEREQIITALQTGCYLL